MSIFVAFFGNFVKTHTSSSLPYPLFVLGGLLLWNVFSNGLSNASNSMITNANIIKKIYFPRLILPVTGIIVPFFDFFISLLLFASACIYFDFIPSWHLFYALPIALSIVLITTLGLGLLISSLSVKFRDFKYIVPFLIQILLFLTPVIYPSKLIPFGWLNKLLELNPIGAAIEILRAGLTADSIQLIHHSPAILLSIALLFIGGSYFKSTEHYFADLA
jgi:lipopolysaccharide transport system permease protein